MGRMTVPGAVARSCPAGHGIWTGHCPLCPRQGRGSTRQSATERGYDAAYQRRRAAVLVPGARCHLCGGQATPGDPLVADHVVPRHRGGRQLAPAHRSCNARKGGRG